MNVLLNRFVISEEKPFLLAELQAHLRVEDETEEGSLESAALAAASDLEHFAQLALLDQKISVSILKPDAADVLRLPVGPLLNASSLMVELDGAAFEGFEVIAGVRPVLIIKDTNRFAAAYRVKVEYTAGYGMAATDIPPDLRNALLDQAALHYDGRSPMDARQLTNSPHMARIAARYRGVQL